MAYNNYMKNTDAWHAFEFEVKPALEKLDAAETEVEAAFEALCDQIDTLVDERDSETEEKEELERQVLDLESQVEELTVNKAEVITLLTNMYVASEAMSKYAKAKLIELGALNETISDHDSDGAGGDGAGQGDSGKDDGSSASGVTRPQIP